MASEKIELGFIEWMNRSEMNWQDFLHALANPILIGKDNKNLLQNVCGCTMYVNNNAANVVLWRFRKRWLSIWYVHGKCMQVNNQSSCASLVGLLDFQHLRWFFLCVRSWSDFNQNSWYKRTMHRIFYCCHWWTHNTVNCDAFHFASLDYSFSRW